MNNTKCDHNEKIFLQLVADGSVVNHITRSPYGALLYQTNPKVWLPIGFQGAIEDPVSGVTIFNGKSGLPPYDSHIGQVSSNLFPKVTTLAICRYMGCSI